MIFTDKYGRVHDRQTDGVNPSSNNGWFYSAVYKKLGGIVKIDQVALFTCAKSLIRHPDKSGPPISRDEVLGLEYLSPGSTSVVRRGWNFSPFPVPKFNLIAFLKQAVDCIDWKKREPKHRNYFWQQGYSQIYRLAFSVPWSDRHTILKLNKKFSLCWYLAHLILNRKSENRSARQLYWFKTGKDLQGVVDYHPEESPIKLLALEKLGK
jgi:hypothetical protein